MMRRRAAGGRFWPSLNFVLHAVMSSVTAASWHEPTERLGLDKRVDLLRGNVGVVAVEDHRGLAPALVISRSRRRSAAPTTI